MSTLIDSLVVALKLDPTGFVTGNKQALVSLKETEKQATRSAKTMEAAGGQAAEFFAKIKNEALGLLAVLVGGTGVIAVTDKTVNNLAALGRAATNIGIAVPQLAAFRNAVEANGGSADAATASFKALTDQMEEWKATGKGSDSFMNGLAAIGGSKLNSALEIYLKFAEFASRNKDNIPLVNLIGGRLGLDQGSINEAQRGAVQVQRDLADAMKRGVPTDAMIGHMQAFQRAFIGLEQAVTNVGQHLVDDFAQPLTNLMNEVTVGIEKFPKLAEGVLLVAGALTSMGTAWAGLRLLGLGGAAAGAGAGAAAGAAETAGGAGLLGWLGGPLAGLLTLFWSNPAGERPEDMPHPATPGSGTGPVGRFFSRAWSALGGGSGGGISADQRNSNIDQLRAYFRTQGYSDAQIAGILSNLDAESGFNPGLSGDNGTSGGIAQWHADRLRNLEAFTGKPWNQTSLMEQAAFLQHELNTTEAGTDAKLRQQTDPRAAAAVFSHGFERPADDAGEAARRFQRAPAFTAPTPGAGGGQFSSNSSTTNMFTGGTLVVNSAAKDAGGIAGDIKAALQKQFVMLPQANSGLS